MDEKDVQILSMFPKTEYAQKMTGTIRQNLGQKRRSVTPMHPVAIAPKTNLPKNIQTLELSQNIAVKNDPGFITIIPRMDPVVAENESNKSIGKINQFEILESFTCAQNAKRIKLTEDVSLQYIILQNPTLDHCDKIVIADNNDRALKPMKTNVSQYTMLQNDHSSQNISNVAMPQCNVGEGMNSGNSSIFLIPPRSNFPHQEQLPTTQNSQKSDPDLCLHKNNSYTLLNCNEGTNSKKGISKNMMTNHNATGRPNSSIISPKSKSQKPVVIMQQFISPPTALNSGRSKRILVATSNKALGIQGMDINTKTSSLQASSPKSNETVEDSKTMNPNTTRNTEEHESDLLLKKEFPIISSSQVDSVLQAIDMQGLQKGIITNEIDNHSKKGADDRYSNNGRSLPCTQGAAKLHKSENTGCPYTATHASTILQTNLTTKRFHSEKSDEHSTESNEKYADTLQCFKCKECSYMSLSEKHIFQHIEKEHNNTLGKKHKPILKCPGCLNTFQHEASLLSHMIHDHQVCESEAQIIVQQLSPKQIFNEGPPKPFSQIHITKSENEQIFVTQTSHQSLGSVERAKTFLVSPSPMVATVNAVETQWPENNASTKSSSLPCIQAVNTVPLAIDNSLDAVDIENVPFLIDDKTFLSKTDDGQDQEVKLLATKNVDSSENFNAPELKSTDRNFQFVNFKNETKNEDDGYLQEDDPIERGISESEMQFVTLTSAPEIFTTNDWTETKKKNKGRPKGFKSNSSKPQSINLKQGFKCKLEECGVRMLVRENIVYHEKCHVLPTIPRQLNFECPECEEFKSNNWSNLAGHLWRSHIIDMELHSCDLCSYKTPSLSNLMNQHRGIHGDERPFVCNNCGKGFKTTKQLRNHRALHRAKDKEPLKCDECGRNFTNMRLLKLHKDSVHKESKPYTCNACSYSASTRSALKLHLRRHTGEKPFMCNQCSYSTGDHNSLRRHKLRHIGLKPYSCPHCSYACIQSSTYKVHLKNKHPGLDHNLMFSCQFCSYKSIKKENLLTHMAKHEQTSSSKLPTDSRSPIVIE
ncbi:zinc finger protein 624-like [Athalia rosae]|uniref:zinc finger protein 624-like n=1 Tax=Athalia rosae TaxID=37344 RepID=UPI002033F0A0|nr:zinc finger protein 624-like [Athalia rosae]